MTAYAPTVPLFGHRERLTVHVPMSVSRWRVLPQLAYMEMHLRRDGIAFLPVGFGCWFAPTIWVPRTVISHTARPWAEPLELHLHGHTEPIGVGVSRRSAERASWLLRSVGVTLVATSRWDPLRRALRSGAVVWLIFVAAAVVATVMGAGMPAGPLFLIVLAAHHASLLGGRCLVAAPDGTWLRGEIPPDPGP